MKGKIAATVIGGLAATLLAATPSLAGDSAQAASPAGATRVGYHVAGDLSGLTAASFAVGVLDRPCSWRKQKLYFMGEKDANFGGTGIVTILNCHANKRKATIDVARGFDPKCKNIPFGETRKFEYQRLKGIAKYKKPKWC